VDLRGNPGKIRAFQFKKDVSGKPEGRPRDAVKAAQKERRTMGAILPISLSAEEIRTFITAAKGKRGEHDKESFVS
jgi:hypothetical protein